MFLFNYCVWVITHFNLPLAPPSVNTETLHKYIGSESIFNLIMVSKVNKVNNRNHCATEYRPRFQQKTSYSYLYENILESKRILVSKSHNTQAKCYYSGNWFEYIILIKDDMRRTAKWLPFKFGRIMKSPVEYT